MRFTATLLLAGLLTHSAAAQDSSRAESAATFATPGISPDGREIAFASGGDIWTVATTGGEARLLVSDPADEWRPLYSPDGRWLAFVSTRTGNGDVYVLDLANGAMRRLTYDDAVEQVSSWSADSHWLYFNAANQDISGMNDIFRVPVTGGTPMPVAADRYVSEYFASAASDGTTLAIAAHGTGPAQWWRNGSSHLDASEIWRVRLGRTPTYERLTEPGAREMWPMWGGAEQNLYYVSDRGGAANIWSLAASGGTPRQVTDFSSGRVLWPSITRDGSTIAFERDFGIWTLDTSTGAAREVPITLRGAAAGPQIEHMRMNDQFSDLALAPDGKKVAFVVRGEVFAASSKEGGDAARVTRTDAAESQVAWAPDSRRLAYVSERDGRMGIYLYDFADGEETLLTASDAGDHSLRWSPDGKQIAFVRGHRELRVLDVSAKTSRVLATAALEEPPLLSERLIVWSPDGKWVAFGAAGERGYQNVHVVPAGGGAVRDVSFLANSFGNTISWSPDGKYILFDTGQRTEDSRVARVDLIPRTPEFREDEFRELFEEQPPPNPTPRRPAERTKNESAKTSADTATKAETSPTEIVFADIRRRLSLLPVGVDVSEQIISRDGKTLLLVGSAEGQTNLYTFPLDELSKEPEVARQITSTPGFKSDVQFTPDGKEVFYLGGGRIYSVSLESRQPKPLAVSAEMDVDFSREKAEIFHEAWDYLDRHFYDAQFHGVDWGGVAERYAPQVRGSRTPDELRRILNLMVGELNSSHSGVYAPGGTSVTATGHLGLRFDREEYERTGRLKVTEVIPLGPAAVAGGIAPGDYLLAVDGTPIDAGTNLDALLQFTIGKRVPLAIADSPSGAKREVVVQPVSVNAEKNLVYRAWVEANRAYVEQKSGGRLGYVHMVDMSADALQQLYVDLDAENQSRDGVVIDIRNNNGGFVNVYAIDVLARRGYLTMTPRGYDPAPARSVLGQRALERPTVLVTNQHSLSDAEDFTEGYRTLGLGKVVGEPTAGWIIYTWGQRLIDGSLVRLPRMKVQDARGQNMEGNPRPVDVEVRKPVGESYAGVDTQLDAAVKELLQEAGRR